MLKPMETKQAIRKIVRTNPIIANPTSQAGVIDSYSSFKKLAELFKKLMGESNLDSVTFSTIRVSVEFTR